MINNSDQILIRKYLQGDEKSLEVLILTYLKPIYSFTYRYVGSARDAEDITQEVFVKVWRHLKRFDQSKSFKTWVFAIAKNTAIDFLRKKKAIPFSDFDTESGGNIIADTVADAAKLPQEIFKQKEITQTLESAMTELSPKYRIVLFLRYNDHFTFREIAESLDEPLHTVKSRHRRALVMLKKLLKPESKDVRRP